MQRRLIIMRHAKSSWGDPGLDDHDRPLNERGRRDAPRIGERLAALGWTPDLISASDAQRTRETAALMIPALDDEPEVRFDPNLYLAGLPAIHGAAASWPAEVATALVLGHNPGWAQAASLLAAETIQMTTANAALFESSAPSADWPAALAGAWTLVDVLRPKELE